MAVRTPAQFSGLYLTTNGEWPDNTTGEITPQDLKNGVQDTWDSWTASDATLSGRILSVSEAVEDIEARNTILDLSISASSSGISYVDFASGLVDPPWKEGRIFYDSTNKTYAIYDDQSDTSLQLGQEMRIRCVNKTSAIIPNGTVVRINGAQGNRPTIIPAIAQVGMFAGETVGITTHAIQINQEGLVTIGGTVADVTGLDSYAEGDELYLSTTVSGGYTNVIPSAPLPVIHIGHVLSNHAVHGKALVHLDTGSKLTDLCDVNGSTAYNGFILARVHESGFWDPTDRLNTSGGFKFGDVAAGNYAVFEEDTGFLATYGSGVAWDDLRIAGNDVGTGASAPDLITLVGGGLRGYGFDGGAILEQVYFEVQMPHAWKLGSTISPHVHWTPTTVATGSIAWFLEYTWAPISGTFSAPTTISGITEFTTNSQWKHFLTSLTDIDGSAISGVSSMLICRLYRDPGTPNDTYAADAGFLEFDIHYQIDSRGSRQEFIK